MCPAAPLAVTTKACRLFFSRTPRRKNKLTGGLWNVSGSRQISHFSSLSFHSIWMPNKEIRNRWRTNNKRATLSSWTVDLLPIGSLILIPRRRPFPVPTPTLLGANVRVLPDISWRIKSWGAVSWWRRDKLVIFAPSLNFLSFPTFCPLPLQLATQPANHIFRKSRPQEFVCPRIIQTSSHNNF